MSSAGRLHRGRIWICGTERELATALAEWAGTDPLLVQPYIRGTGEGVFGLATSDGIRAWSAHRRLRMMNPHGSGASACQSQSVPEQIRGQVECFVRQVKWRRLFMVEFFATAPGFSGSWNLTAGRGVVWHLPGVRTWNTRHGRPNWPWRRISSHQTREPSVSGAAVWRETCSLLFLVRGPQSAAVADWPSFWKTAYAGSVPREGLPA